MLDAEKLVETQRLYSRLCDYWHEVDTNRGRDAASYYTEGAMFVTSKTSYVGRTQIAEFYRWRAQRGPRVAVHLVNNFRAAFHDDNSATTTWYLTLFADDGEPVLPTAPPILVALVTDQNVRDGEGRWFFSSRSFDTLFEGGVPVTNPVLSIEMSRFVALRQSVPRGHGRMAAFLVAIRRGGTEGPCAPDGLISGHRFIARVERLLASALRVRGA
jgi:hypothetical protein